jgi:hypothetical protein
VWRCIRKDDRSYTKITVRATKKDVGGATNREDDELAWKFCIVREERSGGVGC